MEFKFRAIDEEASKCPLPPSSSLTYFSQQALRAGYAGADYGRPTELYRNPTMVGEAFQQGLQNRSNIAPFGNTLNIHGVFQPQLEKERIREESADCRFNDHLFRNPSNFCQPMVPREFGRDRIMEESTNYGRPNEMFRYPSDIREVVQRELEKERIREEIIAGEIARKRLLEEEVRREILMERAMEFGRMEGFSLPSLAPSSSALSLPAMPLDLRPSVLNQSVDRSFEERLALSLGKKLGCWPRNEVGGLQALPFQRSAEPKISEVKPHSEVSKEKPVIPAECEGNLSGVKRKAVTPPVVGDSEPPSVGSKKKSKEEWSCALCQVSATSEIGLNEHLQGKKHKSREAGLRAGKNFTIGLLPKKNGKMNKLVEIDGNPSSKEAGNPEVKSMQVKSSGVPISRKKLNVEKTKNNNERQLQVISHDAEKVGKSNGEITGKVPRTGERKKKFLFWCEMCQIGAHSEKVFNSHRKGKKHLTRLLELYKSGGNGPADQMAETTAEKVKSGEADAKDEHEDTVADVDRTASTKDEHEETSADVDRAACTVEFEKLPVEEASAGKDN